MQETFLPDEYRGSESERSYSTLTLAVPVPQGTSETRRRTPFSTVQPPGRCARHDSPRESWWSKIVLPRTLVAEYHDSKIIV